MKRPATQSGSTEPTEQGEGPAESEECFRLLLKTGHNASTCVFLQTRGNDKSQLICIKAAHASEARKQAQ
eukprot:2667225-Alexandrium_andersonii.AAC.1